VVKRGGLVVGWWWFFGDEKHATSLKFIFGIPEMGKGVG